MSIKTLKRRLEVIEARAAAKSPKTSKNAGVTKYPKSACEEHLDVKTSEPVCVICMANEIEKLRGHRDKLLDELRGVSTWINRLPVPTTGATARMMRIAAAIAEVGAE